MPPTKESPAPVRVLDGVQRIRGADENSLRAGGAPSRANLFDDDIFRAELVDLFQRRENIVLLRELMPLRCHSAQSRHSA